MKICILSRPPFDAFATELYNTLREKCDKSLEMCYVTTNAKETNYVLEHTGKETVVYETAKYIRGKWNSYTYDMLSFYEQKYDASPIWKYIYTDRFLINMDYDYAVRMTIAFFDFFENIFSDGSFDFYYSEPIATLQCYVAYLVGKKYGVTYFAQPTARGNMDMVYHYYSSNPFMYDNNLVGDYLKVQYDEEEKQLADKYLTEFENKYSQPGNMGFMKNEPKLDLRAWACYFYSFVKRFDPYMNDPYSYIYYKVYKVYRDPVKYYFRYRKAKKYFHEPDYSLKYVYFPLHYQPEATTIVCAQKYEKQLFYLDNLAKSIPGDTVIFVKEHYAELGNRDNIFYKQLQQFPNIIIINPFESSRKLIENCVAVATLTGTVGWEAMLLRKPVLVSGQVHYDNAPGIMRVPDIFGHYMDSISNWRKPAREDIIQYLCACLRSYKEGNSYCMIEKELINDNIEKLAMGLYEEMVKIKNEQKSI